MFSDIIYPLTVLFCYNNFIMEQWKDIPWYTWLYQASSQGSIKSIIKWKILANCRNAKWYIQVVLYNNKKTRTFRTHRLVMLAFIWPSDLQVNHKNWIRDDNRLENLEYCTASENMIHSYKVLKRSPPPSWIHHYRSKRIIQLSRKWVFIKNWDTIKYAWLELNINQWNISEVCNLRRKTAWGFIWKYK